MVVNTCYVLNCRCSDRGGGILAKGWYAKIIRSCFYSNFSPADSDYMIWDQCNISYVDQTSNSKGTHDWHAMYIMSKQKMNLKNQNYSYYNCRSNYGVYNTILMVSAPKIHSIRYLFSTNSSGKDCLIGNEGLSFYTGQSYDTNLDHFIILNDDSTANLFAFRYFSKIATFNYFLVFGNKRITGLYRTFNSNPQIKMNNCKFDLPPTIFSGIDSTNCSFNQKYENYTFSLVENCIFAYECEATEPFENTLLMNGLFYAASYFTDF